MKVLPGDSRHAAHPVWAPFHVMNGLFTARPLAMPSDIRRAYGLVSLACPDLSLQDWAGSVLRCRRHRKADCGIVILHNKNRIVFSVFRYVVDRSLLKSVDLPALLLHDVVLAQFPGEAASRGLACCARTLASTLGCTELVLNLSDDYRDMGLSATAGLANTTLQTLLAAGFARSGCRLVQHSVGNNGRQRWALSSSECK